MSKLMREKLKTLNKEVTARQRLIKQIEKTLAKQKERRDDRLRMHSIHRIGQFPEYKYQSVCNARLIKKRSHKIDTPFKNATYYESGVTCKKCIRNMRPHAGACPKCGVPFDNKKETYCGNCGEHTRERPKLNK